MSLSFLNRPGAPTIAYEKQNGNGPTVVFLTGFRSDMAGTKAEFLAESCRKRGQGYIRFDYRGHGQSEGRFEDGTIGLWKRDALDVIDFLTNGSLILVGSSMGGWIALLCALERKDRVKGLIGLAAAPDFTEEISGLMSPEQHAAMERDGFFTLPNDYDDRPYIIRRELIEDGKDHLLLHAPIDLDCPVRLVQGMKDADVPWHRAQKIADTLTGADREIFLREEGDHRLSTPEDLALLERLVIELSEKA
jgi:pimeloyl-ACP methyl ester carboxylesterase